MEKAEHSRQATENAGDSIFSGEEFSIRGYDRHIRQARNAIFTAAAILLISIVVMVSSSSTGYPYLWIDAAIWSSFAAGFIALGIWTKKKPYYAITGALILYGLFIILNAFIDVSTIFKGIILKIVIIVLLIKGLGDARSAQEMKDSIGR